MIFRVTILSLTLAGASLWAQPGRGPTLHSPEVSPDGKVTFRLRAPNAKEVAVTGIGQPLAMQKDEQGVWSATTETLKPDLYTYSFSVDGATFNDPQDPLFKASYGSAGQSMVRVPGPALWNSGEGPHGAVTHYLYRSAAIGDDRDYYVYTPPNYDSRRKEPYPVLCLLHGLGDDASAWLNVGAANIILDNLINQGKAKPMIMVNTLGYGTPNGPGGAMGAGMIPAFAKALVDEVLPQVEKNYHAAKDRNHRAIAGLSMGGAESIYTGLTYLDRFAYIGSFSGAFVMWPRANPAPPPEPGGPGRGRGGRGTPRMEDADFAKNFPNLTAKTNSQLRLVWIACGLDDGLNTVNRQFKAWLKSKDFQFTDVEVPGYAHVWPLWRRNLAELAPLLF
ncbi:MAG: alpha/beta hydrolase-fold protein [Bryobacteraceae bacterium]